MLTRCCLAWLKTRVKASKQPLALAYRHPVCRSFTVGVGDGKAGIVNHVLACKHGHVCWRVGGVICAVANGLGDIIVQLLWK
jgi:hypothetical protein